MTTSVGGRPPVSLPLPPPGSSPELQLWAGQMKATLEAILNAIVNAAQIYTVSNNSGGNVVRSIDCAAPVLATTTNVLATLLTDLQNKGILKR